ncbi:MAG: peptidylprolyl isomerase [Oceanospirillaceae bacterium]|nr:peptidylprolyl isomerase [Oceanospirillaceae bacterium]
MKTLFLSLCFLTSAMCQALVQYDLDNNEQVAQTRNLLLEKRILDMLWFNQKDAEHALDKKQILQQVLDDSFMADYAQQHYAHDTLLENSQVGFADSVLREQELSALLRSYFKNEISAALRDLKQQNKSLYRLNNAVNAEILAKNFTLQAGLMIEASPSQVKFAQQTVVANLSDGSQITLWDIYQRQNIQGKLSLLKGNMDFLQQQTEKRAMELFILHQGKQLLNAAEWQCLVQVLENRQDKNGLLRQLGFMQDMHDDNPVLRDQAQQVSSAEIEAYYAKNKENFRIVNKVKVRHVQLASQAMADAVFKEIQKGLEFDDAVETYSIAADKNDGGKLGWLLREDKDRHWLHALSFLQQKGVASRPVRSPQEEGEPVYEILMVDEREMGYLPVEDEGVRYEASRAVAWQKMRDELVALQKKLRDEQLVHLNKHLQP